MNDTSNIIPPPAPMPDNILSAIGRLVTCWAAVEAGLPLQLARLVAWQGNADISVPAFYKAGAAISGADAAAMLSQMKTLVGNNAGSEQLCKAADKLRDVKSRRDEMCHWIAVSAGGDKFAIACMSASRAKLWQQKTYTLAQLNEWADTILRCSRTIDEGITEMTGLSWTRIEELQSQWSAAHPGQDGEIPAT